MPVYVRVGGVWRNVSQVWVRVSGVWRNVIGGLSLIHI